MDEDQKKPSSSVASKVTRPTSKNSPFPEDPEKGPEDKDLEQIHQDELDEDDEAVEALEEQASNRDPMTRAFEKHHLIEIAGCFKDYYDDRFPRDEKGDFIKVSYLFMFGLTIVDILKDDTDPEIIQGRKWALEKLGFKYTWAINEEIRNKKGLSTKVLFVERIQPLKKKVKWPYNVVNALLEGERLVVE